MPDLCKSCGELGVIADGYCNQSSDVQRVCNFCGAVESESNLVSDDWYGEGFQNYSDNFGFDQTQVSSAKQNAFRKKKVFVARGRLEAIKLLKMLAITLSLPTHVKERALYLYEKVYGRLCFGNAIDEQKNVAACCCYVSCRENGLSVTIKQLADLLHVNPFEMIRSKDSLMSMLCNELNEKIEFKQSDLSDLIDKALARFDLGTRVAEATVKVVQLCKKVWLVDGRQPLPIIVAASYLVWQSQCLHERLKTPLKKYCQEHELEHNNTTNVRFKEMSSCLCEMAKCLPWLQDEDTKGIKPSNIAVHLADIIRYQETLLLDTIKASLSSTEGCGEDCIANSPNHETNKSSDQKVENSATIAANISTDLLVDDAGNGSTSNSSVEDKVLDEDSNVDNCNDDCNVTSGSNIISPNISLECNEVNNEVCFEEEPECSSDIISENPTNLSNSKTDKSKSIVRDNTSTMVSGKRKGDKKVDLTVPPCFKKIRTKKSQNRNESEERHTAIVCSTLDLDSENLSSKDLTDEEFTLYVRTEEETNLHERMQEDNGKLDVESDKLT